MNDLFTLMDKYVDIVYHQVCNNTFETKNSIRDGNFVVIVGSFLNGYTETLYNSNNIFISVQSRHTSDYSVSIDIWENNIEIDITESTNICVDDSFNQLTEEMYLQLNFLYNLTNISYDTLRKICFLSGMIRNNMNKDD
ncbi:hypothetical protein N0S44_000239 [Escherichia coli]|nr:hypothetical protein [Escherichia coli]EJR1979084.1 hypothetical protein [Escherichia coli]